MRECVADIQGFTCLIVAAYFGHTETVRYLVGLPEVVVNSKHTYGYTAVHVAAGNNHADVVELLIDAGADIEVKNNDGRSPLHVASRRGNFQVVKILVRVGVAQTTTETRVLPLRLVVDTPRLCVLFCACLRWM